MNSDKDTLLTKMLSEVLHSDSNNIQQLCLWLSTYTALPIFKYAELVSILKSLQDEAFDQGYASALSDTTSQPVKVSYKPDKPTNEEECNIVTLHVNDKFKFTYKKPTNIETDEDIVYEAVVHRFSPNGLEMLLKDTERNSITPVHLPTFNKVYKIISIDDRGKPADSALESVLGARHCVDVEVPALVSLCNAVNNLHNITKFEVSILDKKGIFMNAISASGGITRYPLLSFEARQHY